MLSTDVGPHHATLTNRVMGNDGPRHLLIVDDEETIRLALAKFMRARGFTVQTADSGSTALDLLRRGRFALMLTDIRMPGMTGAELVSQALAVDPELAIVMLTAVNDAPTATEVLSQGAMDYLMKPIELNDLLQAVERVLHRRDLAIEQRNVERLIREEVALRTAELEREKGALRLMAVAVVDALINAEEAKDLYLRGHSQRVAALGAAIAEELELDADAVEEVRLAGRLHDVGKIGIREEVLNKPGPLTADEFEHVKDHVRIGVEILLPLRHIANVIPLVQDHHEHWDGTGYPRGFSGDHIALGGRILCAADAFDALTSRRAWREPMEPATVIEFLRERSGTLLDPRVFEALQRVVARRSALVFLDDS